MKTVQSGEQLVFEDVTISYIEQIEKFGTRGQTGLFFYCTKKPIKLTVDSPGGSWEIDLEDLIAEAESGVD